MKFISNRKETEEELENIYNEIFNHNATKSKIKSFKKFCNIANKFSPSERCKGKRCVVGLSCGNLDSKIMFIAEAPGRNGAERTGIPIYGDPSGDNFENILLDATNNELDRTSFYITNSFLWNPTKNGNNDRPTEEELDKALPFLESQIEIVKPELIVALGMTAYQTLGKLHPLPVEKCALKSMAGKVYKWTDDLLLSVMYHPSPRVIGTYRTMDQMVEDLKNILKNYITMRKDVCMN